MKHLALAALAALVWTAAAAQQPPQSNTEQKKESTCPSPPGPAPKSEDAKPVEDSAILPSAGGHQNSAAPTVQKDGKPMEQRADCPPPAKGVPEKPAG